MPHSIDRFSEILPLQAGQHPHRVAVVFEDLQWTYQELDRHVSECASAMLACGVKKGDRIATLSTPRPEYLVTYLATIRIGAIWFGLNPIQTIDEYRYLLRDANPTLLFALDRFRNRDNSEILATIKAEFPGLKHLVVFGEASPGCTSFLEFLALGRGHSRDLLDSPAADISPQDVALLVYTSGSTGRPKGAMLTQRNVAQGGSLYAWRWPVQPLRIICNLPISHIACSTEMIAYAVYSGGTIVFQEHFEAKAFLRMISEHRITWISILPTMLQRIVALPGWERYDTSSLEVAVFGGAAMSSAMIDQLAHLSSNVYTLWGLTESTVAVTFTDPGDSLDTLARSIGRAGPGHEVAIMNGSTELGPDEAGEIVIRGPTVFAGYFGMPESSAATIDSEGWLHSGDLGRRDAEGRFYVVGRIKEMFKSGGYNIYPREVEAVIESHPSVSICAVVPVSDPVYQEVGFAFVTPASAGDLTASEVEAHCRAKLGNYKIPKRFIIRESLPMLAIGKVDKVSLRAEAEALAASAVKAG